MAFCPLNVLRVLSAPWRPITILGGFVTVLWGRPQLSGVPSSCAVFLYLLVAIFYKLFLVYMYEVRRVRVVINGKPGTPIL